MRVLDGLPAKLRVAANYVLRASDQIAFMTVRQLADAAGVAPATIVRLARAAGYDTFDGFRDEFRRQMLADGIAVPARAGSAAAQAGQPAACGTDSIIHAISGMLTPQFDQQIDRIGDLIVQARSVHVAGYRSAHALAHYLAYLGRTAFPKFRLVSQADTSAIDHLAHAGRGDLVIIYSFRPYSTEAVRMAQAVKAAQIDLVAITDCADSPLAAHAREYLAVPMPAIRRLQSLSAAMTASELILERSFAKLGAQADEEISNFYARVRKMRGYWEP